MLTAFLLVPSEGRYSATLQKWGKAADISDAPNQWICWNFASLALLEYRRNQPDRALEWARKSLAARSCPPTCMARDHVIMAMALARLNQTESARSELDRCREPIESKFKGRLGLGTYETGFWKDWLIDRILLREAESLVASPSTQPSRQS
jgi:hypothetical protein